MLNWVWKNRYASFNSRFEVYLYTLRDYLAFDFMEKYDGRILDRKDAVEKGGYIVSFGKSTDATKAASYGEFVVDTGATPATNVSCKISTNIIGGDKFDVEVAAESDLPTASADYEGKRYAINATCVVKECKNNAGTYAWVQVGTVYKLYMTSALGSNLVYVGLSRYEDAVQPGEIVTLTYNVNGGSGTAPIAVTVGKDEGVKVVAASGVTPPSGKTFDSWNTKADGSGTEYTVGDTIIVDANTTLYAIWA